jgi:hypothetical protein
MHKGIGADHLVTMVSRSCVELARGCRVRNVRRCRGVGFFNALTDKNAGARVPEGGASGCEGPRSAAPAAGVMLQEV